MLCWLGANVEDVELLSHRLVASFGSFDIRLGIQHSEISRLLRYPRLRFKTYLSISILFDLFETLGVSPNFRSLQDFLLRPLWYSCEWPRRSTESGRWQFWNQMAGLHPQRFLCEASWMEGLPHGHCGDGFVFWAFSVQKWGVFWDSPNMRGLISIKLWFNIKFEGQRNPDTWDRGFLGKPIESRRNNLCACSIGNRNIMFGRDHNNLPKREAASYWNIWTSHYFCSNSVRFWPVRFHGSEEFPLASWYLNVLYDWC